MVKCRLATYSESYVYSDSFPYGTLDEVTVLVIYVLVFPFFLCNRELIIDPEVNILELKPRYFW